MASLPYSMSNAAKDGIPDSKSGVWSILVHPSPPGCSLSSANLLYREVFSSLLEVGVALFQAGQSTLGWLLGDVKDWKLSMTYPGENPSPFSLSTKGCCFATLRPTRHLLTIPNISVGMGALYEGLMASLVPPTQELRLHLFPRFLNYIDEIKYSEFYILQVELWIFRRYNFLD